MRPRGGQRGEQHPSAPVPCLGAARRPGPGPGDGQDGGRRWASSSSFHPLRAGVRAHGALPRRHPKAHPAARRRRRHARRLVRPRQLPQRDPRRPAGPAHPALAAAAALIHIFVSNK